MANTTGHNDYSDILPYRGEGKSPTVITREMFDADGKYVGEPLPTDPEEKTDIVFESDLGQVEVPEIRTSGCIICGERTGLRVNGLLEAGDRILGDELPGETDENGNEIVRLRFPIEAQKIICESISCGGDIIADEIRVKHSLSCGGTIVATKITCGGFVAANSIEV